MAETSSHAEPDLDFGAQLYEAFRAAGRLDLVTRRFNYNAIQRLKKADREHALKLFQGASWAILQRLKTGTPQQVVQYFLEQERRQLLALGPAMLTVAMVMWLSTSIHSSMPGVGDAITILASMGAIWLGMRYLLNFHQKIGSFRHYALHTADDQGHCSSPLARSPSLRRRFQPQDPAGGNG